METGAESANADMDVKVLSPAQTKMKNSFFTIFPKKTLITNSLAASYALAKQVFATFILDFTERMSRFAHPARREIFIKENNHG